jgi:hypothetical protein
LIEVTFDLRKSWDIFKKTSQRGLRQTKLRYFREKEELFNFTVCSVGCFTLREGIRTSNDTLSKIAKYHFVENSKILFRQSYSEIIYGRLPMD